MKKQATELIHTATHYNWHENILEALESYLTLVHCLVQSFLNVKGNFSKDLSTS
jgi:hypothetical protein